MNNTLMSLLEAGTCNLFAKKEGKGIYCLVVLRLSVLNEPVFYYLDITTSLVGQRHGCLVRSTVIGDHAVFDGKREQIL